MLAGSPREQSCELRTEQPVTAERWEEVRSMIASGLKMGEQAQVVTGTVVLLLRQPCLHALSIHGRVILLSIGGETCTVGHRSLDKRSVDLRVL